MAPDGQFICVSTDTVQGRSIAQILGLVWGIGITDRRSDDIDQQLKAADAARHDAYSNLVERARAVGANAVVAVSFNNMMEADGSSIPRREYTIYGTAVILE